MIFKLLALTTVLTVFSMPVLAQDRSFDLVDKKGKVMGQAVFKQAYQGKMVWIEIRGLKRGWHGVHIYTVGNCSDDFKAAGEHMTIGEKVHGIYAGIKNHTGDLPNLWSHNDGLAKAEFFAPELTEDILADKDGSALIIYDSYDDFKSQPLGNPGEMVACGVVAEKKS